MNETVRFIDQSGAKPGAMDLWPAIVIPKETIDAEVERLASLPRPANGRRRSLIAHPRAGKGNGLAAGIQVALDVLLPGERTVPYRAEFDAGELRHPRPRPFDRGRQALRREPATTSGTRPPCTSIGTATTARMSSPAHLFERCRCSSMMNVHFVEENPPPIEPVKHEELSEDDKRRRVSPYGTFKLNDEGAHLMPYEVLINPPAVESPALHWPWEQVKHHLDKLQALGKDYVGRRLYMLYNPMTGRTNG